MTHKAWLIPAAALFPFVMAAVGSACGTTVSVQGPSEGNDGGGGFIFIDGGSGGDHTPDGGPPDGSLPDYTDPGCPDKPPPLENFECDPYTQNNGDCLPEEGCYIYVDYPSEPCGQEIYGSLCIVGGNGQQGDTCNGAQDCGGGFVCVITGSGTQCVQLCQLSGESGCAPGLVCDPIDVVGFGGCL
jgi:hypothetical protein